MRHPPRHTFAQLKRGYEEVAERIRRELESEGVDNVAEMRPYREDQETARLRKVAPAPAAPRLQWGSIWAGSLVAVVTAALLQDIGLAVSVAMAGSALAAVGAGLASWMAIAFLIAAFVGGVVSTRTADLPGSRGAVMQGITVWALAAIMWVGACFLVGLAIAGIASIAVAGNIPASLFRKISVSPAQLSLATSLAGRTAAYFVVWYLLGLVGAIAGAWAGASGQQNRQQVAQ